MTDKEILASFKDYKKKIIKLLGKKALLSDQLSKMGKKLFGKKYLGTYPQDKFPIGLDGYCIINTDVAGKQGEHWVALVFEPKKCFVYDSFGRLTQNLLPILEKRLVDRHIITIDADHKPEQFGNTEVCGQLSMSFLLCCDTYGVEKVIKVI